MGTVLMLLGIFGLLIFWDLQLKFYKAVSTRLARYHLDRVVANMARQLLALVKFYGGLTLKLDRRLLQDLPSPTLVCANHQSIADIAVLMAALSNHRLRFVAKKELSRGFPAVSEVLRIQRHALIARGGAFRDATREMRRLGRETAQMVSPVIFPEGTRSHDGVVRRFHPGGVRTILQEAPIPITAVAVDGGYQFVSMKDLLFGLHKFTYRAKLVGVFTHEGDKQTILDAVARAQDAIAAQVSTWHAQPGHGHGDCKDR
jgi:1-acyl-sn-glycerol-3-phosphate acyltransferase